MKGLELFETAIQKEGDKQNDFEVCKKVTYDNINTLLIDYTLNDVYKVQNLIDKGYIHQNQNNLLLDQQSQNDSLVCSIDECSHEMKSEK